MDLPQPTARDISYFQAHPEKAEKFDARFGDGAAAFYLPQPAQSQPPHTTPVTPQGVLEGVPATTTAQAPQVAPQGVPVAPVTAVQPTKGDVAYPEFYEAWVAYERYEADAERGVAQEGDRGNLLLEF